MHARARACPFPLFAGHDKGTPRAWRKVVFATSASARLESGRDGAETLRVPAGTLVEDHRVRRRSDRSRLRSSAGFGCFTLNQDGSLPDSRHRLSPQSFRRSAHNMVEKAATIMPGAGHRYDAT